ncbi:DUF2834 domain-containing protein [Maribacter sp. 2210JD10-5]|uniref:DUF2834 domain-containing protein n=1 Tax=Maribacter sp. 2210JD10-5 TaxID=3386272 RepID=UPI0039BCCBF4
MKPRFTVIEIVLLLLSLIGIAATWYFNILFYFTIENTSIANFIALANATLPAKSISADISVVAITFLIWMVYEARKLKMRHWWLFIPLTFLIAIAFSFPLFLFFRERKIRALNNPV